MQNTRNYTLLELNSLISESLSVAFPGKYWITAEINEIRENFSGHCYLELVEKDKEGETIIARLKATIWSYTWRMLKPYFETSTSRQLSRGMQVLVEVTVEFHELYGLSLNIKDIDPVYTLGDLEKKRLETIKKLEKEGIIEMNRSLEFPLLPSRIAIISSPVAAGYEDFSHQIKYNPSGYNIHTTLFPAIMQGVSAEESIISAMDSVFNLENDFDLLVILRGGGSTSDLNCFNNYNLAANIAQFPIPVITGIGHERDHTIAGMVAHTNLKTPTAVADFILSKFLDQEFKLGSFNSKITIKATEIFARKKSSLKSLSKDFSNYTKRALKDDQHTLLINESIIGKTTLHLINLKRERLIVLKNRSITETKKLLAQKSNRLNKLVINSLPAGISLSIKRNKVTVANFGSKIESFDPLKVLKRGYAVIKKGGLIIKSIAGLEKGDTIQIILGDGNVSSKVEELKSTKNGNKKN